nr:MAG TPA: hypothetical protein [Caudoviricetes sp.]
MPIFVKTAPILMFTFSLYTLFLSSSLYLY